MRRLVVFLALTSLLAGIFAVGVPAAQAGSNVGSFEIEGNLVDDSGAGEPIDWSTPPPNLTNFDDQPSGSGDTSFGQGSKELEPGKWTCGTGGVPGKDDITSGQIAFRTFGGKQFIYTNYTRSGVNGDAHIDYEFNQSNLPNTACPALPRRTNGDIVITFDTENGGAQIFVRAFRWTFKSGSTTVGTFTELSTGSQGVTFDGAVNIPNTIPGHTAGDFGEAALNLTDTIGNISCGQFATTYMKSRASTSISAALKDRTNTQPANVGECPNSSLAKAVRNVTTNGSFGTSANASPGDTIEYRLTYTNSGTVAATNVVVTDVIQPKQTFVSGSCTPACTGTGTAVDPLRWTFASVAPGGTQEMTFRVVLDASFTAGTTQVKNIAVVDTAEETPKNSNETIVTVTATPNSSVAKAVRNVTTNGTFATTASASPGDTIEYQITYTNTGNVPLTNVVITDVIQAKQTFVAGSCSPSCTGTGTAADPLRWSFASVAVGGSQVMTFRVVLDASFPAGTTNVQNVAVSDSNEEPPETSPPTTVTVNAVVNSSVAKAVRNVTTNGSFATTANASPGDTIEYQITYTNTGNVPLTNVVITDVIQGKQTLVPGSCSPACTGTGTAADPLRWTFASVAPGTSQVMTFRVVLDSSFPSGTTEVRNVAVSDSDQEPPKESPPTIITVTANPNLGLVKSGSAVDTRITWTITYSNTGNAPATGVVITDNIPAGTVFVSCSQNPPCTTTGNPVTSVSWNIGTVAPGGGGSVTLTVDVTGTSGCEICNVASISSPDQTGGARDSNRACVSVTPAPNPAGAHASGSATGANVFSSLLGLDLTLPTGNDGPTDHTSVDSAQAGLGSNSEDNEVLSVLPPPGDAVLRADVLRAVTTSTITANPARANAISVGSAADINILNGTVTASVVRGVAMAEATGTSVNVSSLGSAIEGLQVLGIPQAVFPGARVDLPAAIFGVGSYVAIYEEIKNTSTPTGTTGGTYAGDITVNMIRVHVTGMLVVGQVEVVVGHARAQADFPQTTLCGPQANQSVSGDAFMARVLTDPSIAPVLVGAVQIPTSGGAVTNSVNTIVVDPLLTSRAATTGSEGGFTPLNTTATSSAEVKSLCILEMAGACTIEARVVRAQANSTATGSNRTSNPTGTEFLGLKIASLSVSLPVPANTVIAVPGLGFVILNEQFCDNGGTLESNCSNGTVPGHTGITVRGIHLVLLEPAAGGTPGVEVIVAEAHSDARYV